MYTKSQWLTIVRNILRMLGYNTINMGIDGEINKSYTEEARIHYQNTLQDILNESGFKDHGGVSSYNPEKKK